MKRAASMGLVVVSLAVGGCARGVAAGFEDPSDAPPSSSTLSDAGARSQDSMDDGAGATIDFGGGDEDEVRDATSGTDSTSDDAGPVDAGAGDVLEASVPSDAAALTDSGDGSVGGEAGLPPQLAQGLVIHLSFDNGQAVDAQGLHPAQSISSSNLVATTDRFGRSAGATRFTPPGSLVQVGPPSRMPLGAAPRTLALWVKPRTLAPSLAPRGPHSNVFVHWGLDDCTSKMFGLGHPGDRALGWLGCTDVTSSLPVAVGVWTFMALRYDGNTVTLAVDHQRASRASVVLRTPDAPLAIGGERRTYNQGFTYYFDGDLDDLRVWDRALTDGELDVLVRER